MQYAVTAPLVCTVRAFRFPPRGAPRPSGDQCVYFYCPLLRRVLNIKFLWLPISLGSRPRPRPPVQSSSVKLLPTPMQIQKNKKGPRFLRRIASTRKWAHSSCISVSRESLLYTPVHPDSRRTKGSCGLSAEALVHLLVYCFLLSTIYYRPSSIS